MVKRKRASGSSLFLMELIIAILLFSLAAAICISAFAKSHLLHRDSVILNNAVNIVQNTAEAIRSGENGDEILDNLELLYPDYISNLRTGASDSGFGNLLNNELIIGLNSDYTETPFGDTPYSLVIECDYDRGLFCSIITFNKGNEPIFDLYVEHLID